VLNGSSLEEGGKYHNRAAAARALIMPKTVKMSSAIVLSAEDE